MKISPKSIVISTIIIVFGCIKPEKSDTAPILPIIVMKAGDIKEFTANNLSVIFKKSLGDTLNLSLILLISAEEKDSTNTELEELILKVSLARAQNDTTVHLTNLDGFNALSMQSTTFNLETSLYKLLEVFYNQSFDSLSIDSARFGRFNSPTQVSDEDLQRYHAEEFVLSRLLLAIQGNFSYETVQKAIENAFYGKTVGEYRKNMLNYPKYPFNANN